MVELELGKYEKYIYSDNILKDNDESDDVLNF